MQAEAGGELLSIAQSTVVSSINSRGVQSPGVWNYRLRLLIGSNIAVFEPREWNGQIYL